MPTATEPVLAATRRVLPRLGLTARVFVGATAMVVTVLGAALFVAQRSLRRDADLAARRGLEQTVELVAQFLSGRQRSLAGGARVFVQGPYFRSLVAAQRREDVLDQAIEAAEQLEADWVFITDARGRLVAKSDEPSAVGEAMGAVPRDAISPIPASPDASIARSSGA